MSMMRREADKKIYKTRDICELYDISRSTLFRWENEGLITGVQRDWRGWRLYHSSNLKEIERIIKHKQ
jgi:DNA-binding transcriptional MerR regulator